MNGNTKATVVTSALSALTVVIAWVYRYRIAELAKANKRKLPIEVLFNGYEQLLKSYQQGIRERDEKIERLETSFNNVQLELDRARDIIRDMKDQEKAKDEIIRELEAKLAELKSLHAQEKHSLES